MKVEVTPVFDELYKAVHGLDKLSTLVEVGGAGSSKSHSIAQLLIQLITEFKGLRIGVGRKVFPSHRVSGMALFIELLRAYGIYDERNHNKGEFTYEHNSNWVWFFSLGEGESGQEKIKSANLNIVWLEEATEFSLTDYRQLTLRLRHPTPPGLKNFIILSLNPIDEGHWIKQELINKEGVILLKSTYRDNPFIENDYKVRLENLANEDMNYYRVYVLGEWGKLENVIYRNWDTVDSSPKPVHWAYGLDFGFNNPSALIKVMMAENGIWMEEKIYKSSLTISDIIENLSHLERAEIYCDPSSKQTVEEIKKAGYQAFEAEKEVKHGIDLCRRQRLHCLKDSVNLIKEMSGYQWKVDKTTSLVTDEPVKFNDHAMDAFRYALYGMASRYGFATAAPGGMRVYHPR